MKKLIQQIAIFTKCWFNSYN